MPIGSAPPLRADVGTIDLAGRGVIAETFPPLTTGGPSLQVSGTLRGGAVGFAAGTTVSNLTVHVPNTLAGTGMTHCWFMIYNSALALVAQTADSPIAVQSAGNVTLALTSALSVTASGLFYLCFLATTGTTMPNLSSGANNANLVNYGAAIGSGAPSIIAQTGLAALPNPVVPAAGVANSCPWIAAS